MNQPWIYMYTRFNNQTRPSPSQGLERKQWHTSWRQGGSLEWNCFRSQSGVLMGLLWKNSNSHCYYLITKSSIKSESEMSPFFLLFWQNSQTLPLAFNSVSQYVLREKDGLQSLSPINGERGFKCQLHTHGWTDSINYQTMTGPAVSIVEMKQNPWK